MPGTRKGARKARDTRYARYGRNTYRKMGRKGGKSTARRWKELTKGNQ